MARAGRRPVVFAAAMMATLVFGACGGAVAHAASTGPTKPAANTVVKFETNPGALIDFIGFLAKKEGFFKKNHLDVQFVALSQGVQNTNSLAGGSLDVGLLDLNNSAPLLVKGVQLELIENEQINYWNLEVDKSLQGKTMSEVMHSIKVIGVPSIGGSGGRFFAALEQAYHIAPSSIEEVVDTSGSGFLAGHEHAIMTVPERTCLFESQGAKKAFSFQKPLAPVSSYPASLRPLVKLPDMGFWARKNWVDSHPQTVRELQAALSETIAWVHNHKHLKKIETSLRNSSENFPALTDSQWNSCVASNVSAFEPYFSKDDAQVWGKTLQSTGVIPGPLPATSTWLNPGVPAK